MDMTLDLDPAPKVTALVQLENILRPLGNEVFIAVFIAIGRVQAVHTSSAHQHDRSDVPVRDIVAAALATDCTNMVLVHNHPSGLKLPSRADIRATRTLLYVLEPMGIKLDDHIIVTRTEKFSFRDAGLM